jgi:hypothetical protein
MVEFLPAAKHIVEPMLDEYKKIWNKPEGIIVCENSLGNSSGFGFSIHGMVARVECRGYKDKFHQNEGLYDFGFMVTIFPGNCGLCVISALTVKEIKIKMGWWCLEWAEYLSYLAGYSRVMATTTTNQIAMQELLLKNSWQEIGSRFKNRRSGALISTYYKDLPVDSRNLKTRTPIKLIEKDNKFTFEKQIYIAQ